MTFSLLNQPMAITGESPLWDADRACLWWIDIQAQRLLRTTMDGTTTATPCPWQPGFIALAQSGDLVLGLETGLWTYAPEASRWAQITETEADRPTLRLNDGKPDALGRLWFGSMDMTGQGHALGRLYCRDTTGALHILREGVAVPNSIVPLPDPNTLIFTDTPTLKLERLTVSEDATTITQSEVIHTFSGDVHPDGACLDAEGNLWVALIGSGEVVCLSQAGAVLARLPSAVSRATMPMLGGPDGHSLFLTSQRRFLSPEKLATETAAGGLQVQTITASAAPVHRVAGL